MSRKPARESGPYPQTLIACPDFVFSTLAFMVTQQVDDVLEPLGLRLRHYRLLRLLRYEGPLAQSEIGRYLGIDRTTTVSVIDFLEARGLARRMRSREDRRVYVVELTAKGRALAEKATKLVTKTEERMFAPLENKERQALRRLATRLLCAEG